MERWFRDVQLEGDHGAGLGHTGEIISQLVWELLGVLLEELVEELGGGSSGLPC